MTNDTFKNSAHDLNNILTSIINEIELLKQLSNPTEETKKLISRLENSAKRASDIVHAHLQPNEKSSSSISKINIVNSLNEIFESFSFDEKSKLQTNFHEIQEAIFLLIDETDFFRIIYNIIKNALEASDVNQKVFINLCYPLSSDRKKVSIEIIDFGEGIAEENISKIFDPKFSTKSKLQESGYGLVIVKEKIEKYNGSISVKSKNGETKFTVTFPVFDEVLNKSKRILLAEDDVSVSEVLADLLKSNGYNVDIADNGVKVIKFIEQNNFDLLIIDKKMPEMDGLECVKKIRDTNKSIPIILASGSNVDSVNQEIESLGINKFIRKPYNFSEILAALQKFD